MVLIDPYAIEAWAHGSRLKKKIDKHERNHDLDVFFKASYMIRHYGIQDHVSINSIIVAGFMHDTQRKDHLQDLGHGYRAAVKFREIVPEAWVEKKLLSVDSIVFALENHDLDTSPGRDWNIVSNYTIPASIRPEVPAIVWDADRLCLYRVPFIRNVRNIQLNTSFGREYVNSRQNKLHYSRFDLL